MADYNKKRKLIILAGPTAVGKSALSIELAKRIDGEIVSADSMQVYKYMDIGSAKIREADMCGIPHHLINILMPWEEFHVARFKQLAAQALEGIYERGHIPVIVGGTGFYIQALLYDIDFSKEEFARCLVDTMLKLIDKEDAEDMFIKVSLEVRGSS